MSGSKLSTASSISSPQSDWIVLERADNLVCLQHLYEIVLRSYNQAGSQLLHSNTMTTSQLQGFHLHLTFANNATTHPATLCRKLFRIQWNYDEVRVDDEGVSLQVIGCWIFALYYYAITAVSFLTEKDWRPLPLELVLGKNWNCTRGVGLAPPNPKIRSQWRWEKHTPVREWRHLWTWS